MAYGLMSDIENGIWLVITTTYLPLKEVRPIGIDALTIGLSSASSIATNAATKNNLQCAGHRNSRSGSFRSEKPFSRKQSLRGDRPGDADSPATRLETAHHRRPFSADVFGPIPSGQHAVTLSAYFNAGHTSRRAFRSSKKRLAPLGPLRLPPPAAKRLPTYKSLPPPYYSGLQPLATARANPSAGRPLQGGDILQSLLFSYKRRGRTANGDEGSLALPTNTTTQTGLDRRQRPITSSWTAVNSVGESGRF